MEDIVKTKFFSQKTNETPHEHLHIQTVLRKSNTFCDATISLADGGSIPVHRVILSAASDYLHKLFLSPINANQPERTRYNLKYIRTEIMECIVEFAYSFNCNVNEVNLPELIATAEYLCFFTLVDYCARFISTILNIKNCISLMLLTRKCLYEHEIQHTIRQFVLRNFVEVADFNDELLYLPIADLLDLINDDALNTRNEETGWEFCLRWIEFDEHNRLQNVPSLLAAVRLGLLNHDFFERRVLNHEYVRLCPEAKPIITTAQQCMSDLDEVDWLNGDFDVSCLVPRLPCEILFAIGGWLDGVASSIFETYDNRADRWIEFDFIDPFGGRAYHGLATIDTKIYCIGGYSGTEYYNKCTVFDVSTKIWKTIAPMHHKRCYVSVCVYEGKIYAIGGHDGHTRLKSMEVYIPETNQWTLLNDMTSCRSVAAACEFEGKIYIAGGFNGIECLRTCEVYDIAKDEWSFIREMQHIRSGLKTVSFKGQVYALGGYNGLTRISSCERYNPNLQSWSLIEKMATPRSNFAIEVIDDRIFVAGGFDGISTIKKTEFYSADENTWTAAASMSHRRSAHAMAKVSNIQNVDDFVYDSRVVLLEGHQIN